MKKNVIKLNEGQLRNIIAESVKRILNEREFNYTSSMSNDGEKYIKCPECGNECLLHDDDSYECQVCGHNGYPGEELYKYMIVTYEGENEVDRQYINLPRPDMHAYDNDMPFTLGSNQALIPID